MTVSKEDFVWIPNLYGRMNSISALKSSTKNTNGFSKSLFTLKEDEKNSQWACQEGIKFFKGHTMKHFADEEAYMASINYDKLAQHQSIHKGFHENTLPALEQELVMTNYSPDAVDHFLGVCAGWLIGHTLTEDLSITGKAVTKWENLLPSEELAVLKKVIPND